MTIQIQIQIQIFNTNQLHEFQCSDHPNLRINAITEVRDKSLIFFNDIYFTTAKIEVDKFVGEIESFNSVKKLIPNIKGHIQSAFTFGNVTYLLNVCHLKTFQNLQIIFNQFFKGR